MGSAAAKTPPVPYKVELKFTDEDLVITWSKPPPNKVPYRYEVKLYKRDGDIVKLVHSNMTDSAQYAFPRKVWDAFTKYYAEVVTMDHVKPKCLHSRSNEIIFYKPLTKDGNVLVDTSKPLETGYRIYEGYVKSAGQSFDKVAVKLIANLDDSEIKNLKELAENGDQHVVYCKMSGDVQDAIEKTTFFVMELCHRDTLREIAEFCENEVKKTALLHMMLGLDHIHQKGFAHGDLKLETIYKTLDGRYLKIANFGTSKKICNGQLEMSEEKESDIFSAGLIFGYILSGGNTDYISLDKSTNMITAGPPVPLPLLGPAEEKLASNLIQKMLKYDTAKSRPINSRQVLTHPFFWDDRRKFAFIIRAKDFLFKTSDDQIKKKLGEEMANRMIFIDNWYKTLERSSEKHAQVLLRIARGETNVKYGKIAHYVSNRTKDLLRFIRNIEEHYHDHEKLKLLFNSGRDDVWPYFSKMFPSLLPKLYDILHDYWSASRANEFVLKNFADYFTTPASSEPLKIISLHQLPLNH